MEQTKHFYHTVRHLTVEYKQAHQLTASVDFLANESGSIVAVSSSNYVILENHTGRALVRIDVEENDTYFVSSSESVVTHNYHFGYYHPVGPIITFCSRHSNITIKW